MMRRFVAITSLAVGTAIAVAAAVATPALAKGATQASITGPGLARPVTISAPGEGESLPGQSDPLSSLAGQTGLFAVLFGPGNGMSGEPSPLRTPPAVASLGPRYTLTYTVPGVTPESGQPDGQVRQYLYPRAAGGPVIYTLPGQQGFGQPLQAAGWLRGTPQLTVTLKRLGVPAASSLPSTPRSTGSQSAAPAPAAAPKPGDTIAQAWLIAAIVSAVVIAMGGTAWWLRRRFRPATNRPTTGQPGAEETSGQPHRAPALHPERPVLAVADRRPGDVPQGTARPGDASFSTFALSCRDQSQFASELPCGRRSCSSPAPNHGHA